MFKLHFGGWGICLLLKRTKRITTSPFIPQLYDLSKLSLLLRKIYMQRSDQRSAVAPKISAWKYGPSTAINARHCPNKTDEVVESWKSYRCREPPKCLPPSTSLLCKPYWGGAPFQSQRASLFTNELLNLVCMAKVSDWKSGKILHFFNKK